MKIIIDTNVTISGLLWGGAPNQILKLCRNGIVHILECDEALDEVKSVLQFSKFSDRLSALGTTATEVFAYSENSASLLVSGDRQLLELESYKGIQIVTPSEGVRVISSFMK